ncbi:MAG: sterol desaturase family protein [Pseudomonadota bacterium]
MTPSEVQGLGDWLDGGFLFAGAAVFALEILRGVQARTLSSRLWLDMLASVSSQVPYLLVEALLLGAVYLGYIALAETVVFWTLPLSAWTVAVAVLACDFLYYWEHRLSHELRLLWTQHAVHHSSRFMNVSVAVRFGPFEGVVSAVVHLPLILLGFPPVVVFFGILVVLAYQTWIHTETIGRLGWLDRVFNTPSNHRVHHGCDPKYLDRNYGGILMVWDHLFGTYQAEEETPRYGLKRAFSSVHPLKVWFSELPGLLRDLRAVRSTRDLARVLFAHPARSAPAPGPDPLGLPSGGR